MVDDMRIHFARLLRDKQEELEACQDRWAKTARSLSRMLSDGAGAIERFDLSAFDAAAEDLRKATNDVAPVHGQAQELRARLL